MNFLDHKKKTVDDCNHLATIINEIGKQVEHGDMESFERFFISGGTAEGDSKIQALRELIVIRYEYRKEELNKDRTSCAQESGLQTDTQQPLHDIKTIV